MSIPELVPLDSKCHSEIDAQDYPNLCISHILKTLPRLIWPFQGTLIPLVAVMPIFDN